MSNKEHYEPDANINHPGSDDDLLSSEIEKIREKTFDNEFRNLVSRVTTHQPYEQETGVEEERDLIRRLQGLFYRSSALYWYGDVYPYSNHLDFAPNVLDESLALHIWSEMDVHGYRRFAILTYDFHKKSFACTLNHITEFNKDNLVLDIDEPLFKRILRNRKGVILDESSVKSDPFLKKRFISEEDGSVPGMIYFLSLSFLEEEFIGEKAIGRIARPPVIPTVLMILLEGKGDNYTNASIYETLKKKTAFILCLYKRLLYPRITEYGSDSIAGAVGILEYYHTLYCGVLEGAILFVRYSQRSNPEIDYIFSYMAERITGEFPGRCAVISLDRHSFFSFCGPGDVRRMESIIAEVNSSVNGIFIVDRWLHRQSFTFKDLLGEYLKNRMGRD